MQQEEYDKLTIELEPLRVNGVITRETQFNWLKSKGIIKWGKGMYKDSPIIIYPKGMTDLEVSQRYLKYEDMLSNYMSKKIFQKVGQMGVKKEQPLEDLPF